MMWLWFVVCGSWLFCACAAALLCRHRRRLHARSRHPSGRWPFRASCGHLLHSPTGDLLDMEHAEFFHLRLCLAQLTRKDTSA